MTRHLDELVESLLYEGYALYPYTPGATKNATPTPFGIVYPPSYAERLPTAFDHLRLECVLLADANAPVSATVRFLQAAEGQRGAERRLELAAPGQAVEFEHHGVGGRARLRIDPLEDGRQRVRVCVHNTTPLEDPEAGRTEALKHSLMSTHVVVHAPGARFLSPMESEGCESVNTFPVLATPEDDTVLGATIMLPDHPRVAPQSHGNLFDGTEIEEALLLHVHALSDGEREAIAADDPAVREMVERAAATTPQGLFDVHGLMTPSRAEDSISQTRLGAPWVGSAPEFRGPDTTEPPQPPADLPDLSGEPEVEVDGTTFHRGDRVVVRTSTSEDPYDRMADGRTATVEKIIYDVDGKLYFAVVFEGAGEEILRDTGRHHFFFAGEVEPA